MGSHVSGDTKRCLLGACIEAALKIEAIPFGAIAIHVLHR
jgi:hypothetical protein